MNRTFTGRLRVPALVVGVALALGGVSHASAQTAAATSTTSIHGAGLSMVREGASTTVSAPRGRAPQAPSRLPRTTLSQNWPELANDPGFETGSPNADWSQSSVGGFTLIDTLDPYAGSYNADLCGYLNCTDALQTTFTVPDNVDAASFYVWIDVLCPNNSTACAKGNNGLTFALADGSGGSFVLGSLYDVDNPSATNTTDGYAQFGFTSTGPLISWLAARAERDVTLSISSATISGNRTEWFVDDVALDVTAPANPPTNIVVTSAAAGSVQATWTAPADAALNHVNDYTAFLYNVQGTNVSSNVTSTTSTSQPWTGLPNGIPYYVSVESDNGTSGPDAQGNSVTPFSGAAAPTAMNATNTAQYFLPNSDGSSWQRIDETNLSFEMTPPSTEDVALSANADLWTGNAGINQDIGICVEPNPTTTSTCTSSNVVAWKESGGEAGTFSPNAAFVQAVVSMTGGTPYRVDLVWKTNRPAIYDTIAVGAGPVSGHYSPTSITAHVLSGDHTAVSTQQYHLAGSDGTTWHDIDTTSLQTTVTPSSTESVVVSGNADLWTASAGDNQDLAVTVSPAASCGGSSPSTLAAWKESGGFAGTFSPNAAFVQTVCTLQAGTTYTFDLAWKANHATSDTIFVGAGNSPTFSPTRLLLFPLPANASPTLWSTQVITTQPTLSGSDGSTWEPLANMSTGVLSPSAGESVLLSANADLWTATAGVNQDIGIFVSVDGATPTLVGWKESGGFGGTFSPNAAFLQIIYAMQSGHTYTFSLSWKANHSTTGTIFAGAGPIGQDYSPTRLTVIPA